MTATVLRDVLDKALLDEDFRDKLVVDAEDTLKQHDLTDEERLAIVERDYRKTTTLAGGVYAGINLVRILLVTVNNNNNIVAFRRPTEQSEAWQERLGVIVSDITESGESGRVSRIKTLLAHMRNE